MKVTVDGICAICGKPRTADHHLIFGRGMRKLADEDGLTIPICDECHTLGKSRIHDNPVAETLSKMVGQLVWERQYLIEKSQLPFDDLSEEAREAFRDRYGRSYL